MSPNQLARPEADLLHATGQRLRWVASAVCKQGLEVVRKSFALRREWVNTR